MIANEAMVAVAFSIQIAEFHTQESLRRRAGFASLGPLLLAHGFDANEGAQRLLLNRDLEVGEALLKQSVVAGIGKVFKSEICHACGVHPFRKVGSLTTREVTNLMSVAGEFLRANVTEASGNQIGTYTGLRRTTSRSNPQQRLWVYKKKRRTVPQVRHADRIRQTRPGRSYDILVSAMSDGLSLLQVFLCHGVRSRARHRHGPQRAH
jgi:endonuclease-8